MSDDWVKKMFGLHDGGVVQKRPETFHWPKGVPVQLSGPTVTGRFSGKPLDFKELPKGSGTTVVIKSQQTGKTAEQVARLVGSDFAAIERRVMAQMAERTGITDLLRKSGLSPLTDENWRDLASVLDLMLMRMMDKHLTYLFVYAGFEAVQQRIDEEGCGAFFAAAKEYPDD